MNRIVITILAVLVALAAPLSVADAGARPQRAAIPESWLHWPWHFPCLRIFGCYPPELPPLTPPGGPNVPGPHCQNHNPC